MTSPAASNASIGRRRRPEFSRIISVVLIALGAGIAYAQQPAAAPDTAAMHDYIMKAKALADGGWGLARFFDRRCLVEPAYSRTIASTRQSPAAMDPVKVMDKLYFLGQNGVSSWALETSEGFIIFDTLNNLQEAKTYVEDGMTKLGLDPKKIKYILLTHEHGDHFGGATYLQGISGARVIASKIAWDVMEKSGAQPPAQPAQAPQQAQAAGRGQALAGEGASGPAAWAKLVPKRDIEIVDGQKFTVADTELTFYVTPGHAQGVLTTIFKTMDRGVQHIVGFNGGLGSVGDATRATHIINLKRWRTLAEAAGVDTLIANHQTQDGAVENLELVKIRTGNDPNPFVVGKAGYLKYVDINILCTQANMARNGQKVQQ